MTAVTLSTVWLNVADTPTDRVSFPLMAKLTVSTDQPGAVRVMANGRLRLIRTAGQPRTIAVDLPYCTRPQITWLETHVGVVCCVRDDRGRKIFGVYLSAPVDETPYGDTSGSVTLTLSEVTFSEVV